MSGEQRVPYDLFQPFGKIARLRRTAVITEKIDGTNAQVCIAPIDPGDLTTTSGGHAVEHDGQVWLLRAGSRNRWIEPGKQDNAGFAGWVYEHADDLVKLGEGRHYGEWWGQGIQRRYGLDEKRFSLFNSLRWADESGNEGPACCHVVPVLYEGVFTTDAVEDAVQLLRDHGSQAAPGFDRPEGVIVYQVAAKTYGKVLLENDELPKSVAEVAS